MIRKKIKVAAYARVSTDKDDQLNSLDNQRIYFQNYIKGHPDWEFVDVYWDEGISGTQTKNRVGFNNMIADAINGKIDLIITKEVSRFARNTVDTLSYTRKLKQFDVGVIFIKEYIIQSYRNALDEIMDIDNPSEMVYKEILDHIDVHKNKVLDIWLKSVPFGIRLKIETEGRSTTYKTKILETELIEKSKGVISKTI